MGDWVSEFPNDNPELFSRHPPGMSDEELVEAIVEAPAEAPIEDEIPIEVVDSFDESDFENATLESIAPGAPTLCDELAPTEPATMLETLEVAATDEEPVIDHWRIYIDALRDVASSFGAPAAVVAGMALTLEADPVARMWRVAINGGEPDFSACAQTLDEWSAAVVARLADAQDPMIEPIRRALRSRGVCAFGLVVEAA